MRSPPDNHYEANARPIEDHETPLLIPCLLLTKVTISGARHSSTCAANGGDADRYSSREHCLWLTNRNGRGRVMTHQARAIFRLAWETVSGYETQKVVQIHSKKIGAFFRLIQLGIILYVILWVMWKEKGYQDHEEAVSGVTAKLKGISFVRSNDPRLGSRVWDAADYVVPPQQKAAFFVMTNLVLTPAQSIGNCDEDPERKDSRCTDNATICEPGGRHSKGSGILTGKCVKSTRSEGKMCEVLSWCPLENDNASDDNFVLESAPDFTVMLKNSIEFPKYNVKRRNILPWMDREYLKSCTYRPDHEKDQYCPIFRLKDIIKHANAHPRDLFIFGGMVSIQIEWNCDLDLGEDKCLPKYSFSHLDYIDKNKKEDAAGKGWNFRFSQHYRENGTHRRNLIKAYGIQFFITAFGRGGKFNLFTFSMNLGSGLALLGIATVLCDMIILNATRNRSLYRSAKVDTVAQNKTDLNKIKREFVMKRAMFMKKISTLKNRNESRRHTVEAATKEEMDEWSQLLLEIMANRDKISEILDLYAATEPCCNKVHSPSQSRPLMMHSGSVAQISRTKSKKMTSKRKSRRQESVFDNVPNGNVTNCEFLPSYCILDFEPPITNQPPPPPLPKHRVFRSCSPPPISIVAKGQDLTKL
ncbi:purinergic receptor P2X, ligand-gated ion channel [Cichlidogyrus casuarinus]|uniref:Purinergic receptor P2X, ligand-gated ion channel n=1 Tax=Cichlidogyrus casuarinus TaxID=1844966 RepID=A0ABD2PX19_9PLAT